MIGSFIINLSRHAIARRFRHRTAVEMNYEECVQALNRLQSNKSTIDQIRKDIKNGEKCTNLQDMERFLSRIGLNGSDLKQLSVIHIAGTKGKGSTSAFCESILRHHGLKTGFFSSPHLVSVRERIRLNGNVPDEELFAAYFSNVYSKLNLTKEHFEDMPKYFAFLTVMAIDVFLREKVDVAIFEVGIGGIVDYTNILNNVPVVGITSLGLDHTSILGNTLEEIAAAKAGIMKPYCDAFTVQQKPAAFEVLKNYSQHINCKLSNVPDYNEYNFECNRIPQLKVETEAFKTNISLAIQLSHAWLYKTQNSMNNNLLHKPMTYDIPSETITGIEKCVWPGRFQILKTPKINYYLDGAHTVESICACIDWFEKKCKSKKRCLLFSATGDRDAEVLLKILSSHKFHKAFFVPPVPSRKLSANSDHYTLVEQNDMIRRSKYHADIWHMCGGDPYVYNSLTDLLENIHLEANGSTCDILVTGSLHLIGAVLTILDPHLSNTIK